MTAFCKLFFAEIELSAWKTEIWYQQQNQEVRRFIIKGFMMALYHSDCFLSTGCIVILYCFSENHLHPFSFCLAQQLSNVSNKRKGFLKKLHSCFLFILGRNTYSTFLTNSFLAHHWSMTATLKFKINHLPGRKKQNCLPRLTAHPGILCWFLIQNQTRHFPSIDCVLTRISSSVQPRQEKTSKHSTQFLDSLSN